MSIARKRWSPDEKKTAMRLSKEGFTHKQIADKLRPGVKTAWRSVGEILREQRKQEVKPDATPPTTTRLVVKNQPSKTIDLPSTMADSYTAREFMTMMDDYQREIFVATYEDLRGEADEESLTKAENEMLIRAAFTNVKYLRAQSLLNVAESYMIMEMEGALSDSDEDKAKKRFAGRSDAYKKEAEQWQKEYMDYLDGLKLTRKQRLDKIKDTRNTFLDLQNELTGKARRESIVEDIKRINRATEEEFHRMAKGEKGPDGRVHPWLIGAFDDYLGKSEETLPNTASSEEESGRETPREEGHDQENN